MALCACLLVPLHLHAQKNMGEVTVDTFQVTKGSRLDVYILLNLSNLHVSRSRSAEVVPLLAGPQDTLALPRVLINGRTRQLLYLRGSYPALSGKYAQVIRRRNGSEQHAEYHAQIPYEDWMEQSRLLLVTDLCGCGWRVLQSGGSPVTALDFRSPSFSPQLAYIAPAREEVKQRQLEGSAFLDFPVNKTTIYPDYRNNPRELALIQGTIDSVRDNRFATITAVDIKGYASPEGAYHNNARLAQGRARALLDYVRQLYHFDDVRFTVSSEPEDWMGLERMVEASNLEDKKEVLEVIRDPRIKDWDARDARLKQLQGGVTYARLLAGFYPALRHSDYTVYYTIRNFTVEEARSLLHTDPRQLSLEEMYRVAQTYEPGSNEFNEVFEIAVRMYPDDPVSNLNAANTALLRKDPEAARRYLLKALPGKERGQAEKALKELEEYLKEK